MPTAEPELEVVIPSERFILGRSSELEDAKNEGWVSISAERDLTKEDLEEFARFRGYADCKAYFKALVDEEPLPNDIIACAERANASAAETEIAACSEDKANLHGFLIRKYRSELLANFMKEIHDRCADFSVEA